VTDRLKDFLARHVFHPLQGMALGEWWALLRRHRFAIDVPHLPRTVIQTAISASNTAGARIERMRFGRRIEAARVEAPLFILGHYRSGTTHLHNLLALDPQFASPTFFQVLTPHTFLTHERFAAPLADRLIVRRRYQDEMALGAGVPSEDEFALCTMTGLSPYMAWCFRGRG
jgi:omega-hydroxy-beta-dihydromenaquinone-9 sulfotransferase